MPVRHGDRHGEPAVDGADVTRPHFTDEAEPIEIVDGPGHVKVHAHATVEIQVVGEDTRRGHHAQLGCRPHREIEHGSGAHREGAPHRHVAPEKRAPKIWVYGSIRGDVQAPRQARDQVRSVLSPEPSFGHIGPAGDLRPRVRPQLTLDP